MTGWWYLSFAGAEGFRGAVIVRGFDIASASLSAHMLGINPGGQVLGTPVPDDALRIYDGARERLLSRAELESLHGGSDGLVEVTTDGDRPYIALDATPNAPGGSS